MVARSCFVGMQIKCGGAKANLQCERNAYRTYVRTYLATGVSSASASSLDIPSMSTSVPNGAYTVGTAVTDGSDRQADRQAGVGVHTQSDWLMRKSVIRRVSGSAAAQPSAAQHSVVLTRVRSVDRMPDPFSTFR
eukprot:COSAG06_NODE_1550_length_9129_cov_4.644408_2_plen_135_part_00